jgi:hypothetical protein
MGSVAASCCHKNEDMPDASEDSKSAMILASKSLSTSWSSSSPSSTVILLMAFRVDFLGRSSRYLQSYRSVIATEFRGDAAAEWGSFSAAVVVMVTPSTSRPQVRRRPRSAHERLASLARDRVNYAQSSCVLAGWCLDAAPPVNHRSIRHVQ